MNKVLRAKCDCRQMNHNEIINDEHYFQVVLWHLSGVMYSRIANLESDEINKAIDTVVKYTVGCEDSEET